MNIGNWKVTRSDIGGHAEGGEAGIWRGRGQKGPLASLHDRRLQPGWHCPAEPETSVGSGGGALRLLSGHVDGEPPAGRWDKRSGF